MFVKVHCISKIQKLHQWCNGLKYGRSWIQAPSVQINDYKIGICCFSAKHKSIKEQEQTGWHGLGIMCPSGATCLPADCCFQLVGLMEIIKM